MLTQMIVDSKLLELFYLELSTFKFDLLRMKGTKGANGDNDDDDDDAISGLLSAIQVDGMCDTLWIRNVNLRNDQFNLPPVEPYQCDQIWQNVKTLWPF